MRAEVISIGDELTSGQRLDTNSQWLSQRLADLGIETAYHTTVADDMEANVGVFAAAIERADVVVVTGGLGPTADDLTREALAAAAGCELKFDADALRTIEAMFARRSRPMPERNRKQAYFPAGSRIVPNPQGTAPGIDLDAPRAGRTACRVFALPGVPAEMREMWDDTVSPALRAMNPAARIIRHRRIKCFGVGESDLEQMLPDLIRRGRTPSVGITVHEATITLRITTAGTDDEECRAMMEPTAQTIYECLGELVYGEEDDELEHAVVRLLRRRDLRLATTEWGTAGLVAQRLSYVAEAAGYYAGGAILSGDTSVVRWLDTTADVVTTDDACLSQTTARMAETARARFGADLGLAVGPAPDISKLGDAGSADICIALATREGTSVRKLSYAGHSEIVRSRAAKQALNLVRLELLQDPK